MIYFMEAEDNMNTLDYEKLEKIFIEERDINAKGHKIVRGQNAIILTAPHSVSQIREGNVKVGEFRTGLIVKLLAKLSSCHIAFKTKNLNDDANYDAICDFKTDLVKYIKEENIKLVLDFHLSKPKRDFSVDIGTGYRANIINRLDILHLIKEDLETIYQDIKVDDVFPASFIHTVSSTVAREANIPAFQLEINWNIVDDYEKMDIFIEKILEIINKLEAII